MTRQTSAKAPKGTVQVKVSNGRLQLVFRYGGKRHYISTGLAESRTNWKVAEAKAKIIEADIIYERFDQTLQRYLTLSSHASQTVSVPSQELRQLWSQYVEARRSQVETKTLLTYKTFGNHIERLPSQSLDDNILIRDHIIRNIPPDTGKRLLTRISACCRWAVESGIIERNPFEGMAGKIKLPKSTRSEDFDIDPFSKEEQDSILSAYANHPTHKRYCHFIQFLLLTGARPSEVIGLKWKHIRKNQIFISEPVVYCQGKPLTKACTKTGKGRTFPINEQLKRLLDEIRSETASPETYLFSLNNNQPINYGNFYRSWKGLRINNKTYIGIVSELAEKGIIQRYRKPYQCRHTFITQCLEMDIPVTQVAKWVGNSPEVIMRHYAGIIQKFQVPEF
jgi:integrase